MPSMALAIAGLAAAWALQSYGAWRQIKHDSAAMGDAARAWSDGLVGIEKTRSRFGGGTVVLLVVDPDRIVRRLMVMRGVTVFARFRRLPEVEGLPLDAAVAHAALGPATRLALTIAADQVDRAALATTKRMSRPPRDGRNGEERRMALMMTLAHGADWAMLHGLASNTGAHIARGAGRVILAANDVGAPGEPAPPAPSPSTRTR